MLSLSVATASQIKSQSQKSFCGLHKRRDVPSGLNMGFLVENWIIIAKGTDRFKLVNYPVKFTFRQLRCLLIVNLVIQPVLTLKIVFRWVYARRFELDLSVSCRWRKDSWQGVPDHQAFWLALVASLAILCLSVLQLKGIGWYLFAGEFCQLEKQSPIW